MNLKNCPQCGKIYVENSARLCQECLQREEDDERKIVEYLRDVVDHASVEQIHEATGVAEKVILRMIKQGRIVGSQVVYPCEGCGTPITDGQYCRRCQDERLGTMNELKRSIHKEEASDRVSKGVRMYTQNPRK